MATTYDSHTALLVVDVQNDFSDAAGSLSVDGGADIIPEINAEIEAALAADAFVVYTQDWHPASTRHFARDGGIWPVHCVAETWGAELHPDLISDAGPRVRKGGNGEDGYSGFTTRDPATGTLRPTELSALLGGAGIEATLICGLATDYCVRATALDAVALGYRTAVLVDAIRAVDLADGDGDRAIAELRAAGVTMVRSDRVGPEAGVPTEGGS